MTENPACNQYVFLKVIAGIVLGSVGSIAILKTGVNSEALSILWISLGAVLGFITGISDHIKLLQNAFERGRWLIVGIGVLFLFMSSLNYFDLPILISLALGFSSGVLISMTSVVVIYLARS